MHRNKSQNESLSQITDITAGCFAGAIGKIIEYPLDTLKVRCQINQINIAPQSTLQITRNVFGEGDLFQIYRGFSAPLFGSCITKTAAFWLFGSTERHFKKYHTNHQPLAIWQTAICGGIAGASSAIWLTPIEYVKCQMQAPHTAASYGHSTWRCLTYNLSYYPMNMFNRNAFVGTACREIPGSVMWFSGYKLTTRTLTRWTIGDDTRDHEVPSWISFCGGAVAGVSYWTCCYPMDLIKSLIQTEHFRDSKQNSLRQSISFWKQFVMRYRAQGFLSLYCGFGVTVPRAILSNGTVFLSYEYYRNILRGSIVD